MGPPNPGQLSYRILTLLPGVRVGSGPPNRPSLRCPAHLALRERNDRGDAQGRPRQHPGTSRGRANATHTAQAATTSLPRPQRGGAILQHGDLVLRRIQTTKGMHKLSASWEGPFLMMEVVSPSTYRLQWADGQGVPNVRNIKYLCRFYP
jgi:hypothetical protein